MSKQEKRELLTRCYQLALMDRRVFSRGAEVQPIALEYLDEIMKAAENLGVKDGNDLGNKES